MNIIKSIQARKNRYDSRNFEKTKWGKTLGGLKNVHKGEKCVIVGNGPSLTSMDLQTLHELHIPTFGTNRIFNIFSDTDWRPTYFASEDEIILQDIQEIIPTITAKKRFIPINLYWDKKVDIKNADYFYLDYNSNLEKTFGLSIDVPHCIRCKGTVTITCIQLAIHMGFSEIYLIGVDHNYSKMIDENGNTVEDQSIKDYFSDKYDEGIRHQLVHNMGEATRSFLDVEKLSRKMKSFKVYNATRGGKLEVFERVNFDDIFKKQEK